MPATDALCAHMIFVSLAAVKAKTKSCWRIQLVARRRSDNIVCYDITFQLLRTFQATNMFRCVYVCVCVSTFTNSVIVVSHADVHGFTFLPLSRKVRRRRVAVILCDALCARAISFALHSAYCVYAHIICCK